MNPFSGLGNADNADCQPRKSRSGGKRNTIPVAWIITAIVGTILLLAAIVSLAFGLRGMPASTPQSSINRNSPKPVSQVPDVPLAVQREITELKHQRLKLRANAAGWRIVEMVPLPEFKGVLYAPGAVDRYGKELELEMDARRAKAALFASELVNLCLSAETTLVEEQKQKLQTGRSPLGKSAEKLKEDAITEGMRVARSVAFPDTPETEIKIHANQFAKELSELLIIIKEN